MYTLDSELKIKEGMEGELEWFLDKEAGCPSDLPLGKKLMRYLDVYLEKVEEGRICDLDGDYYNEAGWDAVSCFLTGYVIWKDDDGDLFKDVFSNVKKRKLYPLMLWEDCISKDLALPLAEALEKREFLHQGCDKEVLTIFLKETVYRLLC